MLSSNLMCIAALGHFDFHPYLLITRPLHKAINECFYLLHVRLISSCYIQYEGCFPKHYPAKVDFIHRDQSQNLLYIKILINFLCTVFNKPFHGSRLNIMLCVIMLLKYEFCSFYVIRRVLLKGRS
jgi:hypothetical protein